MKRILWAVQAAFYYILTLLLALLPASMAMRMGGAVGMLIPLIVPKRRAIAIDNISQALPFMKNHPLWNSSCDDPEKIADETFKNLGRSLLEICRLYHGRGEDIFSSIELQGVEHFLAASLRGKGVVFLGGHCGNWELMALALCRLLNVNGSVVVKHQKNPYLNRMVEIMRGRYNSSIIYKKGALKGMIAVLRKGGNIGLLADQAMFPHDGALIEVLGRKAWASKAPVVIANKTGSAILPTFIRREGDRHIITIHPEHKFSGDMSDEGIIRETQSISRHVEDFVVAHPTQWYWVHRRWKRAGEPSSCCS
jgi:KDO2-lipid IV(A) lauroyltransferase